MAESVQGSSNQAEGTSGWLVAEFSHRHFVSLADVLRFLAYDQAAHFGTDGLVLFLS